MCSTVNVESNKYWKNNSVCQQPSGIFLKSEHLELMLKKPRQHYRKTYKKTLTPRPLKPKGSVVERNRINYKTCNIYYQNEVTEELRFYTCNLFFLKFLWHFLWQIFLISAVVWTTDSRGPFSVSTVASSKSKTVRLKHWKFNLQFISVWVRQQFIEMQ